MDTLNYALDPFNLFPDVEIGGQSQDGSFAVGISIPDLETGIAAGIGDANGDGNIDIFGVGCTIGGHFTGTCIQDNNFDGNFETTHTVSGD